MSWGKCLCVFSKQRLGSSGDREKQESPTAILAWVWFTQTLQYQLSDQLCTEINHEIWFCCRCSVVLHWCLGVYSSLLSNIFFPLQYVERPQCELCGRIRIHTSAPRVSERTQVTLKLYLKRRDDTMLVGHSNVWRSLQARNVQYIF